MSKTQIKVLQVEDNPSDVIFLREALATDTLTAFSVTSVERLSKALTLFPKGQFDIILLDLGLPDSQGLETFTRLHQALPETPIVIFSGLADEAFALQAVQAGAQDYLVKGPVGFSAAARAIRYALERQQAQESLRISEARYHQVLDSMMEGCQIIGFDWRYLYLNATAEKHVRRSQSEILGRTYLEIWPGTETTPVFTALRNCLEAGHAQRLENVFVFPDGTQSWYSLSIQPVPQGVFILSIDITERKNTELALRQSEENYRVLAGKLDERVKERTAEVRDLYDKAPAGYHSLDENGNFVMINETELNWLGYTRSELVGVKKIYDLLSPAAMPVFAAVFSKLKTQGSIKDVEIELMRKDGSLLPVLINVTAQRDNQGNFLQSRATLFDNTERRQAEIALRESRERLNFLLAKTPAMIFTARPTADMPITFISDSVRNILGYEPRQYLDDSGFWATLIHPEDLLQGRTAVQNLMANGHAVWESRVRRADNEYLWMSTGISLLRNETGQPMEIIGYSVDIKNEKIAQEALNISEAELRHSRDQLSAANAALEKAARMKDEFLASMSHELRTPLTGILGLSEALQMKTYGTLSEKQLKAVQNIEQSGRHLLALINDILDLSKIEAGKLELQLETFSLSDICQSSLQLTKGMAHQKNQKVSCSMGSTSPLIYADPRRVKQMLVNLLSNAIKFTPEGGDLGLTVEVSETDEVIRLTVWDHGIGIEPEDQLRLFQPFVQLDSRLARQSEGTGLGLALVQRMTELHGGSLELESRPGEGSRFTIVLPWSQPITQPLPRLIQQTRRLEHSLTVEDNLMDAELITRYLQTLGLKNIVLPVGSEAVDIAAASGPDVILLDLQLPDKSGMEVLAELKADERTQSIPVIITSVEERRAEALALGAAGYLVKPFSLEELRTGLKRAVTDIKTPGSVMVIAPIHEAPLVLIVDDNEVTLQMLADFLEKENLRVVSARNGLEMLKLVPQTQPDIILMDIQMPGMDGLEATRQVRAHADARLASIPIIALTALAMAGDRERCMEAGASEYLSKPVNFQKLMAQIFELLPLQLASPVERS